MNRDGQQINILRKDFLVLGLFLSLDLDEVKTGSCVELIKFNCFFCEEVRLFGHLMFGAVGVEKDGWLVAEVG